MTGPRFDAWTVGLCCQASLLLLGLAWGSFRTKPRFLAWVAASLLRSIILLFGGGWRRDSYLVTYALTEPVLLGLLGLAVHEAYSQQARGYASMGRAGRWLLQLGLGLAAIAGICVFSTQPGLWPQAAVRALILIRLALIGFLAAFTLCAGIVFTVWKSPSSHPAHFRLLTAHLMLVSAALASANWLGQQAVAQVNAAMLSGVGLLWLLWVWALWRDEEETGPAQFLADNQAPLAEQEAQELIAEVRRAASGRRR